MSKTLRVQQVRLFILPALASPAVNFPFDRLVASLDGLTELRVPPTPHLLYSFLYLGQSGERRGAETNLRGRSLFYAPEAGS